jgi:hypothetical protein
VSEVEATGTTALSSWLEVHGEQLGRTWASELQRHYRQSDRWNDRMG